MVICEMCGKEVGKGIRIKVDRAVLLVGPECTRFGVPVEMQRRPDGPAKKPAPQAIPGRRQPAAPVAKGTPRQTRERDPLEGDGELVVDYSRRIMKARNELGFKQEELAAKLNEKRSVIRDLEAGTLIPNNALIKKLEKQLKITLTERVSHEYTLPQSKRRELTLGDFLKE